MTNQKMPVKAKPFKHQREAFDFAMELYNSSKNCRGIAQLVEMGCGKTLTAIGVAGNLYNSGKIKKLLVVCPLSIVDVWQSEFKKFADFDYELSVLKGSTYKKIEALKKLQSSKLQVAVVNYESVWRMEHEFLNWKPDFIIADESHKIKTHNISASKAMHHLGYRAKYRMILTGTVITNKAIDVFSQYKFVEPSVFGNSFYAFRNKYFDLVGFGNHTPVLKESMKEELMEKIHNIAFRATKAECLDLPETTDIIRYVELEPKAMEIYKSLVKDSFADRRVAGDNSHSKFGENLKNNACAEDSYDPKNTITVTNVLTKLLRLSQLTGGFLGSDEGNVYQQVSKSKLDALEDIIDDAIQNENKLVVIARFVPEIKAIQKLLKKKNIKYSLVMGGVKDRMEQIYNFQHDPKIMVFIGQIATAGMGITLTASSTMVFYSLDYSMSNFEQTKARIHRAGQEKKCTYIYLLAKGTVDEKVLLALQNKIDLAKNLIDDYKNGVNPYAMGGN